MTGGLPWSAFGSAATVAFLLSATCALSQEIDGSSRETFERSVAAMGEDLSDEDKEIFAKGLLNLMLTEYPPANGLDGLALLAMLAPATEAAHISLDGFTFDQIMSRGRELSEGGGESFEAEVQSSGGLLECLVERVELVSAKLVDRDYGGKEVVIEVRNGLSKAIAGIWIEYSVREVGRTVAWANEDFVSSIPGGIEPGEVREIRNTVYLSRDAGNELVVDARVLDVADAELHLFIHERGVMGWPETPSEETCP